VPGLSLLVPDDPDVLRTQSTLLDGDADLVEDDLRIGDDVDVRAFDGLGDQRTSLLGRLGVRQVGPG
jgi:hypothetical protein